MAYSRKMRTMNERLDDAKKASDAFVEKYGINFHREIGKIVLPVEKKINAKSFLDMLDEDAQIKIKIPEYELQLTCEIDNIRKIKNYYNEDVFNKIKNYMILYFVEAEEYEKCTLLQNIPFEAVDSKNYIRIYLRNFNTIID